MRRKIEYRQYKRQDKKELTRILAEQIYNHFFEKEKDAQKYSRFVLKRAIGICKYGEVAVAREKIVGAIFGIKKDKNHFLSDLERMVCYAQLKIRKKNREALKSLLLLDQMEQELMDKNNVDNEKLIFLFLLERRYEKAEIQEALLTEWESVGNGQKDKEMWIVVNGRAELLALLISPALAVRCLIVYNIVQFIENQLIYPRVVGGSVGLPPLYTLIAAMIGGKLFGIIGIIFFIPLMAVVVELVKEDAGNRLSRRENRGV